MVVTPGKIFILLAGRQEWNILLNMQTQKQGRGEAPACIIERGPTRYWLIKCRSIRGFSITVSFLSYKLDS